MSIRAEHQLDESFLKNVSHGAVAHSGVHYKQKYVASQRFHLHNLNLNGSEPIDAVPSPAER